MSKDCFCYFSTDKYMKMVGQKSFPAVIQTIQRSTAEVETMSTLRKRHKTTEINGSAKRNGSSIRNGSSTSNSHRRTTHADAVREIQLFITKSRKLNIQDSETLKLFKPSPISRLLLNNLPKTFHISRRWELKRCRAVKTSTRKTVYKFCVLLLLVYIFYSVGSFLRSSVCLVTSSSLVDEVFRPRMPCSVCRHLKSVPELSRVSKMDLRYKYAYTPLVIRGAAMNMATNIT